MVGQSSFTVLFFYYFLFLVWRFKPLHRIVELAFLGLLLFLGAADRGKFETVEYNAL